MAAQNRRQVSPKTHKMLWGHAASRCAFPECRLELVMDGNSVDNAFLIGEECHIVAKEPKDLEETLLCHQSNGMSMVT